MAETSSQPEIGVAGAVAQAVSITVPAAAPALVIGSVYGISGPGSWLVYLLATLVLTLFAWLAGLASRAGALPEIAAVGIGPKFGAATYWALLIAYLFTATAVIGGGVNYTLLLAYPGGVVGHGGAAGLLLSLVLAGLAWAVSGQSTKFSTRALLGLGVIPIALILAVAALWASRAGSQLADPAQLSGPLPSPDLLRQGVVLAFFSFTGFESAAGLGPALPQRLVPRALLFAVLLLGLFFILSAYVLVAVHEASTVTLDADSQPLLTLANAAGLPRAGSPLAAGVALSFFAALLGSVNAGGRLISALSARRFLPRALAAPRVASAALAGLALVLSLALSLRGVYLLDGLGYLGGIAGFGFLIAYLLAAIAVPFYLHRQKLFRLWHAALSLVVVAVLLVLLDGSLTPLPAPPYTFLAPAFLLLLLGGLLWSWLVHRRHRQPA